MALFVHGYGARFDEVGFAPLLEELRASYGADRVTPFIQYQDAGFRNEDDSCQNQPGAILPEDPNDGMPIDMDSIGPQWCDSWGDIALNAVKLDADINGIHGTTGEKVVVIANSAGAAITRGMLDYSSKRGDGVAAGMIDSVIFLEGAHDGSQLAGAVRDNLPSDWVERLGFIGGDRPQFQELAPESDWYAWANPSAADLPDLPYFSVFGDIDWVEYTCFLVWCSEFTRFELGDVVMAPGTDDPFDTPTAGGARFLKGASGEQNWQWGLPGEEPVILGADLESRRLATAFRVADRPEFHGNFGDRMGEITVSDCATGAATPLDQALLRIIHGRMDGQPYRCQP